MGKYSTHPAYTGGKGNRDYPQEALTLDYTDRTSSLEKFLFRGSVQDTLFCARNPSRTM